MKNFKDFLLESYGMDYLKSRLAITSGKQLDYFEWQCKNAREVNVSNIPKNIKRGTPMKKQCFKNAFKVVENNYSKEIFYVEGIIILHGIPIDHAWNRMGNTYFDVTSQISGTNYENYISIVEIGIDDLWQYAYETETYGSYLKEAFLKGVERTYHA